jgi:hypothetical protein
MDLHSSPLVRQGSRNLDLSDSQQSWSEIRYLSNEERDQIDLQARVILTRCADRVKKMEALEKRAVCCCVIEQEWILNSINLNRACGASCKQRESNRTISPDEIGARRFNHTLRVHSCPSL